MITSLIPSFNAGELSPLIHLRSDLDAYRAGCRTLLNNLITPYGGVRRRPGLEFVKEGKDSTKRTRIGHFQYSVDDAYILELGDFYMRFYRDGAQVVPFTSPAWVTATDYAVDDYVLQAGQRYRCLIAHTSGTFATDLAAGDWILATIYEISTPWSESQIFSLQVAQVNNLAYLVHPEVLPQKLTRNADDDWDLTPLPFDYPPLRDENTDEDLTVTVDFPVNASAAAWVAAHLYAVGDRVSYSSKTWISNHKHTSVTGKEPGTPGATYLAPVIAGKGTTYIPKPLWTEVFTDSSSTVDQEVTITSVGDIFDPGQVGGYFELTKARDVDSYEVSFDAIATNDGKFSEPVVIQGRWTFNTFGTWKGTFYLQVSKDRGATWTDLRSWESDGDRNVSAEETSQAFESRVLMRIRWEHDAVGSNKPRGVLSAVEGYIRGVVRITEVTDTTHAKGVTITPAEKMTTYFWTEGSWSDFRGFPRTVTAHEQRIVYGGNADQSQTLWASRIDKYEDFRRGVVDSDAWTHSLAATEQNSIQWLLSQKALLVGTSGGEWVLASSKDDTPITPTNVRARRHSGHGSEYLPATLVNDAALFVQRGARKLREMTFSFEADGYVTQDLTMLAEHITAGGIIETSFQAQRDAILWAVTGSGTLLGMTYERGQKVAGWHRHTTPADGFFESVAVLATPGEEDEVWVVVRRTIGGVQKRFIERFRPDQFRAQTDSNLSDLFFVDSGRKIMGVELTEMTGLDHLEGMTVQVVADGAVFPPRVVTGGKITLNNELDPESASIIVAGLGYESQLEPMAMEVGLQNGTSVGRKKRIHEVYLVLLQSSGGRYGPRTTGEQWDPITTAEDLEQPVPLFSGGKNLSLEHRSDYDASFVISQTAPLPMTILAVVPKFNIYGDDD